MTCQLLGTPDGYGLQFLLGISAFLILFSKYKCCESPQRSLTVWLRDVSKIAIGMIVAHLWNMLFAYIIQERGDQCVSYLMNYLVDTILGLIFNFIGTIIFNHCVEKYNLSHLISGKYI